MDIGGVNKDLMAKAAQDDDPTLDDQDVLQAAGEWYKDILQVTSKALADSLNQGVQGDLMWDLAARVLKSLTIQGYTIEKIKDEE